MENSENLNFEGSWRLRNGLKVDVNPAENGRWMSKQEFQETPMVFDSFGNHAGGDPQFDIVERISNRAGKMK